MFSDTFADLDWLDGFIRDRLNFKASELEIIWECENEQAYVSLDSSRSACSREDPNVRIEFGAQDSQNRYYTGVFIGRWKVLESRLGEFEMILLHGKHADISAFVAALSNALKAWYLGLSR